MALDNYCAILVLSLHVTLCTGMFEQSWFLPSKMCAVNGNLEKQPYVQSDPSVTSEIGCVFTCHKARLQGVPCVGAGLDKGGVCNTLRPLDKKTARKTCLEDEMIRVFVVKESCENGGVWEGLTGRCQCSGGWVGERCHRYAHNCSELKFNDYKYNQFHQVKLDIPDSGIAHWVTCVLRGETNTRTYTYLFRNTGLYSNNRKYEDYVRGFSHDDVSYFIGLKHTHALTHTGKTVKMQLFMKKDRLFYGSFGRRYKGFKLVDTSTGYTFDFQKSNSFRTGNLSYNITFGDCLFPVRGIPFFTADHDRDATPSENCAARAEAGWWFQDCPFLCNPLGLKPSLGSLAKPDSMVKVVGMEMMEPPIINYFKKMAMLIEEN